MRVSRTSGRTLTTVGALVATCGVTFGLMSTPASGTPTAPTSPAAERHADDVGVQGWHIKKAKNVSGKPSRRLVCVYVRAQGGAKTFGKACFQPKGDKFWVQDKRKDGMHIIMRAMYSGNSQTIFDCRDYKGKAAGWTACKFSKQMKENRKINFAALAYKGNDLKYRSLTETAQN